MTFSDLVTQIKFYEGFRAKAYYCPAGVLTIGYGRTENVKAGDTTTAEKESQWLNSRVNSLFTKVTKYCISKNYDFTYEQLMALTDFCYNLGYGALDKLTASGSRSENVIAQKILEYCKASVNGKLTVLQGLKKRREWENKVFTTYKKTNNVPAKFCVKYNGLWCYFSGYCDTLNNAIFINTVNLENVLIPENEVKNLQYAFIGE